MGKHGPGLQKGGGVPAMVKALPIGPAERPRMFPRFGVNNGVFPAIVVMRVSQTKGRRFQRERT